LKKLTSLLVNLNFTGEVMLSICKNRQIDVSSCTKNTKLQFILDLLVIVRHFIKDTFEDGKEDTFRVPKNSPELECMHQEKLVAGFGCCKNSLDT